MSVRVNNKKSSTISTHPTHPHLFLLVEQILSNKSYRGTEVPAHWPANLSAQYGIHHSSSPYSFALYMQHHHPPSSGAPTGLALSPIYACPYEPITRACSVHSTTTSSHNQTFE